VSRFRVLPMDQEVFMPVRNFLTRLLIAAAILQEYGERVTPRNIRFVWALTEEHPRNTRPNAEGGDGR